MYYKRACEQITVFDFNQGFGFPIDKDNRWVKLAERIPWSEAEELYASNFSSHTGNRAISFRIALGALIIRRVFNLSDRATVKIIQENPYLQYFLGVEKYTTDPLFDPSMMTHFRERIDLDAMGSITDMVVKFEKKTATSGRRDADCDNAQNVDAGTSEAEGLLQLIESAARAMVDWVFSSGTDVGAAYFMGTRTNRGTLIIDATCCPVNIRYPQDFSLLNEAREKLEAILNRICKEEGQKKPRTYCRTARKEYLDLSKTKKRSRKKIRHVIRIMLNCVKRSLGYLDSFLAKGFALLSKEQEQVGVIRKVYDQQKYMFDKKVNRVDNRIVSLHMPFIRPIVRGKIPEPTEFGPKMDLSVDGDGHSRIEFFSYDAYNEATHLMDAIEGYHERTGAYPEKVLADTIYRNKRNRQFCEAHGIRMSGPKLGRPSSDAGKRKEQKKIEQQDMTDRIEVERHFSRAKRCFGLDRVMEKTEETVGSSVGLGVLLDNLIPAGF